MTRLSMVTEQAGSRDFLVCDCCGRSSRRIWGYAYRNGDTLAAYLVHWTVGQVADHGATIDLLMTAGASGVAEKERCGVALEYRLLDTGPAMKVIDAQGRLDTSMTNRPLRRDEVVGTALAKSMFDIADAILHQDGRLVELLGPFKLSRSR